VCQIAVPPDARAISTLSQVDYEDAFLVEIGRPADRTPERWGRAILDDAPLGMRLKLWSAWIGLGLKLSAPHSERTVLGWTVRRSTPEFMLLGAESRVGMPAELLLKRHQDMLLFDTFVQKSNPLARAVWAAIEPAHERVVPSILEQFVRRSHEIEARE
jgi:hypothetical protein